MLERVTDPADPRVADYVGLKDVVRRSRHEPEAGFFLAEGELVVRRAARAGYAARSLLVAEDRAEGLPDLGCPVYVASYDVLRAVTGFHVHRGLLGSFRRRALPTEAELVASADRLLVLEDVVSTTNLGAVFRSAAGLGMDGVLLSPTCCDPLYRRAVRVSMGEVLAVPWTYADDWPGALDRIRSSHRLLALTPAAEADRLDELVVGPDERVALLLGAEGPGLTTDAMGRSTQRVRIPMAAGVDSLNVAAAAAVACWAVGRRPG